MNAQKIQLHPGRVDESQGSRPLSPGMSGRFLPGGVQTVHTLPPHADGDHADSGVPPVSAMAARWGWGHGLAEGFDEHVAASIPLYAESHALALELSEWFVAPGSTVYDLGASTGRLTAALGERHPLATVIGVDSEAEMSSAAGARCATPNVRFETADVLALPLATCSFVVACHLTPFLGAGERVTLFAKVHEALRPGGALVLFEKTAPADAESAAIAASLLTSHKLARGLDAGAVVAKERALRGVMTLRAPEHTERELRSAGFGRVTSILRWMNWDGYLAVKGE